MKFKRILATALAVILVSQTFLTAFSLTELDFTADYTGEVLAAINTNYGDGECSFIAEGAAEQIDTAVEKTTAAADDAMPNDAVIRDVKPLSPLEAAAKQAALDSSPAPDCIAADYKVGDTKHIYSYYRDSQKVDLVCVYTSDSCTVWNEQALASDKAATADCVALGEYFDANYLKVIELFGDTRIDTDGDGKIALFVYDMEDIGGFFSYYDLADRQGRIGDVWVSSDVNGNACDSINITYYSDYLYYMCLTSMHEYEHYINASNCFVGKNNYTYLEYSEFFIDEAFSTAAEFIISDGIDHYYDSFSYAISFPNEASLVEWQQDFEAYARSFVFGQYIRTRYAELINDTAEEFPGKGIYKKVLESRNKSNDKNSLGVVADILYPADKYPDLKDTDARCRQLLTDFWLAVFCLEPEGVYGFGGEEWAKNLVRENVVDDSLPTDASAYIRDSMAGYYFINDGNVGTAKIKKSDNGMVYVAIDGIFTNITFNPNYEGGKSERTTVKLSNYTLYQFCYREGYSFCGWALTPDAVIADYELGDELSVEGDITLYAVWEEVQVISTDISYDVELREGYSRYYSFTPQESGTYTIEGSHYFEIFLRTNDRTLNVISECFDGDFYAFSNTYMLEADTEYWINIYTHSDDFSTSSFFIKKEPVSYTLTYDMNRSLPDSYTQSGRAEYVLHDYPYISDSNFLGWATEPTATVAEYLAEQTITLTGDLTLYAVWMAAPPIKVDTKVPLEIINPDHHLFYSFTPDSNGGYQFTMSGSDSSINYPDEIELRDENLDWIPAQYDVTLEFSKTYYLKGGETYYIFPYKSYDEDSDTFADSFSVTKISDGASFTLYYEFNGMHGVLYETGDNTYIVNDYVPVSIYGEEFLGWSVNNWGIAQYHAGDEIIIYEDTTLYAVWGESESPVSKGEIVANSIRFIVGIFFYCLKTDPISFLGLDFIFDIFK